MAKGKSVVGAAKKYPVVYDKPAGMDEKNPGVHHHENGGGYRTTAPGTGYMCDSGSTDADLSAARARLYRAAVDNSGDKLGDPGLKDR